MSFAGTNAEIKNGSCLLRGIKVVGRVHGKERRTKTFPWGRLTNLDNDPKKKDR